jgi:molybdopterin-synthase adenylyltransferase
MRDGSVDRYSKQLRFAPFGEAGQGRLRAAKVLLCGCGALGSLIAERLVRAGVGELRLVDRDWVEFSNLQRQALFTERDALDSRPKAIAAAEMLQQINSQVVIEPCVEDITFRNIEQLAADCDLLLDGTDNFETRFLINDYCWSRGVPWVHGGCLGASGQVATFVPGVTACFRCLLPELPPREAMETCDSAGVLGPAVGLIACWQAAEALKLLAGYPFAETRLIVLDSWETSARTLSLRSVPGCPTCTGGDFPFLTGQIAADATVLCGKNAVQLEAPQSSETASLEGLADKLAGLGAVTKNPYFVRLAMLEHTITVFRGGRVVVEGTTSPALARSIVARVIGS